MIESSVPSPEKKRSIQPKAALDLVRLQPLRRRSHRVADQAADEAALGPFRPGPTGQRAGLRSAMAVQRPASRGVDLGRGSAASTSDGWRPAARQRQTQK